MRKVKNIRTGLVWEVPDSQAEKLVRTSEYAAVVAPKPRKRAVKATKED